jgi:hypothetical protein
MRTTFCRNAMAFSLDIYLEVDFLCSTHCAERTRFSWSRPPSRVEDRRRLTCAVWTHPPLIVGPQAFPAPGPPEVVTANTSCEAATVRPSDPNQHAQGTSRGAGAPSPMRRRPCAVAHARSRLRTGTILSYDSCIGRTCWSASSFFGHMPASSFRAPAFDRRF